MLHTYPSRIGIEILIPILAILGGTGIIMILAAAWGGLLILLPLSAFIWHLFTHTYYEIKGKQLRIKCGLFYDQTIEIDTIQRIKPSRNPISAPATALDRLDIRYQGHKQVLVSPKDKEGFVEHLRKIHPAIEYASI